MTIVHIGPPHLAVLYSLGGATERRMREVATRQAQAGSRVVIYSAEDTAGIQKYGDVEIRAIACSQRGVVRAAEFLYKSLRDASTLKPDVLHFHSLAEGAAFTHMFASGLRAKTVLSYDFFEFRRGKQNPLFRWYRSALQRFSSLLPVSIYCQRESAQYWTLPEDKIHVVYNGVSLQQFHPDSAAGAARRAVCGSNGEFVVLYVGRVCEQKGTDLLLSACARLHAEGRKLRLVIAGPIGQFGQDTDNGFLELLKQHQATYLGAVDEAVLPSIYNMADVFVMPTRMDEMFGMAAIEAQACGKPVVCSNHGGLPEVITPASGLLFRTGDVDDLAQQLRTLMDDAGMRNRFALAAEGNAKRFAWETITEELYRVYQQA
jgi:glycosyltransferase involved in cell wall biosynthesis